MLVWPSMMGVYRTCTWYVYCTCTLKEGTSAKCAKIWSKVTSINVSLKSLEGSLGFVSVSTVSMSGLLPMVKKQLVTTLQDMDTLLLQLLDESLSADERGVYELCLLANLHSKMLVDRRSLQDFSSGCMAANSVSVQAVYGPACRASPLRFHSVKRGHSCSDQHWNPPHPRQLHCCTNKGRAVCVKGLQLQLLMELIRLGCTTLIHFSRQHSIDAPLSTHKGLPGSNTCCLKSLQVQTKTALRSWTNIYLQTHAVFMKEIFDHNSN